MNIIQFLTNELYNLPETTEPDVIIELPHSIVLNDCFEMVEQTCNIIIKPDDLIIKLNQEDHWFDPPNEVFLTGGDYIQNYEILSVWHEVAHYIQNIIQPLDETSPKYWEWFPSIFEELCIKHYNLKYESFRNHQLRVWIAISLIDQELIKHGWNNIIKIVEHVQNYCQVDISMSRLDHLQNESRYIGNYYSYPYGRYLAKMLNTYD